MRAKLLELNFKKRGEQDETRINRKKPRKVEEKTPETRRNWMILKETQRNRNEPE